MCHELAYSTFSGNPAHNHDDNLDNHFNHDDLIIIIISALDAFSAKRERQVGLPACSQGLSYFMIKIIISVITMNWNWESARPSTAGP